VGKKSGYWLTGLGNPKVHAQGVIEARVEAYGSIVHNLSRWCALQRYWSLLGPRGDLRACVCHVHIVRKLHLRVDQNRSIVQLQKEYTQIQVICLSECQKDGWQSGV
jgi:hypothetical protein